MKIRIIFFFIFFVFCFYNTFSQEMFKGFFYSEKRHIKMFLNLYNQQIDIPGYHFLGKTHGYIVGDSNKYLYGTWIIVNYKIKGKLALLRFTNDIGSDSQDVELSIKNDSLYVFKMKNGTFLTKAEGRYLVNISNNIMFKKIEDR